jgi:hypothetical protein
MAVRIIDLKGLVDPVSSTHLFSLPAEGGRLSGPLGAA